MHRADSPPDSISYLLSRGLDHYGRNEVDDAVRCWRGVLELDPHHPIARDYLETAGASSDEMRGAAVINFGTVRAEHGGDPLIDATAPPQSSSAFGALAMNGSGAELPRPELERLLYEHRYEEALALLYAARAGNPRNSEIPKSIRLLRERLTSDYAHQLGDLDRVPMLSPGALELTGEEQQVAALVDGISSFFDIAAASPIGRLPTLRILCSLQNSGQLITAGTEWRPDAGRSLARPGVAAVRASRPHASEPLLVVNDVAPDSATPVTVRRARELGRDDDEYADLFARATQAYLVRDMPLAMELFGECCRRCPEDRRPHHNLKALSRRVGK